MTLKEFEAARKDIGDAWQGLANARTELDRIPGILAEHGTDTEGANMVYGILSVDSEARNKAVQVLMEYESLMRDIAGSMQIPWPPGAALRN